MNVPVDPSMFMWDVMVVGQCWLCLQERITKWSESSAKGVANNSGIKYVEHAGHAYTNQVKTKTKFTYVLIRHALHQALANITTLLIPTAS